MKLSCQKFGYKEIPTKKFLIKLYKTKTLQQIADRLGTTKTRVRKWFKKLKIITRIQGAGNHTIFISLISKKELKELIKLGMTSIEISEYYGCSTSTISEYLHRFNIKREYPHLTDYDNYHFKCRRLSEKVYIQNIKKLNPYKYPRTRCGILGGYQLDHIKSIKQCFLEKIPVEIAASLSNLQFIPWKENLNRRNKRYVI
jgi:hypothetical protein